jgi:hypothetical protein
MLAIANKHGEVQASIPGLAQIAGMALADTEAAIAKFLAPDKYSRTPDDEGRRIEPIEGGWLLLNHSKYRAMASKDEEKTASAKRQAAFRQRQKRNGKVTESNELVTHSNGSVTGNRDIAEADADTDPFNTYPTLPEGRGESQNRPNETKSKRRLSPAQRKIARVSSNTETMARINGWFGRREDTLWTIAESDALEIIRPSAAEINGMEAFYTADEDPDHPLHRRTAIITMLNNWPSELDKARGFARKQRGGV